MITLIKATKEHYAEIFQSISVLFAFVVKQEDNTYKQLFAPVKCRDFLGDCIWSKKTNKAVSIYSFNYSFDKNQYNQDTLQLSLTFPDDISLGHFLDNINYIETKEQELNIKTEGKKTDDPLTIVIFADPIWLSNSWKLSLYTFYLKLMCYKTPDLATNPENEYLSKFTPNIEKQMLDNLTNMEENISDSIFDAHNNTGFFSIIRGYHKGLNWKLQ